MWVKLSYRYIYVHYCIEASALYGSKVHMRQYSMQQRFRTHMFMYTHNSSFNKSPESSSKTYEKINLQLQKIVT